MKTIWQRPIAALTVSGALLFSLTGTVGAAEQTPFRALTPSPAIQLAEASAVPQPCQSDAESGRQGDCAEPVETAKKPTRESDQQRFYQRMLMLLRLLNPQA